MAGCNVRTLCLRAKATGLPRNKGLVKRASFVDALIGFQSFHRAVMCLAKVCCMPRPQTQNKQIVLKLPTHSLKQINPGIQHKLRMLSHMIRINVLAALRDGREGGRRKSSHRNGLVILGYPRPAPPLPSPSGKGPGIRHMPMLPHAQEPRDGCSLSRARLNNSVQVVSLDFGACWVSGISCQSHLGPTESDSIRVLRASEGQSVSRERLQQGMQSRSSLARSPRSTPSLCTNLGVIYY